MQRLSPTALRLRRLHALLTAAVLGVLLLVADILPRVLGAEIPFPPVVVPAVVIAVVAGLGWIVAGLVHRSWAWSLEPDHLRVDRGLVVRRSSLIPRRRVQHVSTRVGPLQRQLGLATLVVHTAGARTPNVVVEHLDEAVADALRADLAAAAVPSHAT
jgi:membrane protein YdbS with pleckstrin-like domain